MPTQRGAGLRAPCAQGVPHFAWRVGFRGFRGLWLVASSCFAIAAQSGPSSALAARLRRLVSAHAPYGAAWLRKSPLRRHRAAVRCGCARAVFLSFAACPAAGSRLAVGGGFAFSPRKMSMVSVGAFARCARRSIAASAAGRGSGGVAPLRGRCAPPWLRCAPAPGLHGGGCAAPAPALMLRSLTSTSLRHAQSIFKAKKMENWRIVPFFA